MPEIKPTSVQDLLQFIKDHRTEIENGDYDIAIEPSWVPNLQQDTIRFLARNCPSTHHILAQNRIPEDVFMILARRKGGVPIEIASNIHTPSNILDALSRDEYYEVRRAVACNLNTPVPILSKLSKDNDEVVRRNISNNPKTPSEVLSVLARDLVEEVREAVATNPNTPVETLEILSRDMGDETDSLHMDTKYIRKAVATNPSTAPHILEVLAKDESTSVREAVAARRSNMSSVEYHSKQKFQDDFWKVFLIAGGFLGVGGCAIGAFTGAPDGDFIGFLLGAGLGGLWAFYVAKSAFLD